MHMVCALRRVGAYPEHAITAGKWHASLISAKDMSTIEMVARAECDILWRRHGPRFGGGVTGLPRFQMDSSAAGRAADAEKTGRIRSGAGVRMGKSRL